MSVRPARAVLLASVLALGGCFLPGPGPDPEPPAEIDPQVVTVLPANVTGAVGGDDATDTVTYVSTRDEAITVSCNGSGVTYDVFVDGARRNSDRPCDTGNSDFSVLSGREVSLVFRGGAEHASFTASISSVPAGG